MFTRDSSFVIDRGVCVTKSRGRSIEDNVEIVAVMAGDTEDRGGCGILEPSKVWVLLSTTEGWSNTLIDISVIPKIFSKGKIPTEE